MASLNVSREFMIEKIKKFIKNATKERTAYNESLRQQEELDKQAVLSALKKLVGEMENGKEVKFSRSYAYNSPKSTDVFRIEVRAPKSRVDERKRVPTLAEIDEAYSVLEVLENSTDNTIRMGQFDSLRKYL